LSTLREKWFAAHAARGQIAGMGNEFKGAAEHSAEYFGDTRDHWWNVDFLQLMARRWQLEGVRDVLDVGSGVGHWGRLLASVLGEGVRVTGIEREPRWVEVASERARARGLGERFSYRVGEATRLPFADDTFDLTTCQTLLIHLREPSVALAEMLRVTKPGGRVIVAEPNNLTGALLLDSITNQLSVDSIVELVRFQMICERGKIQLGEGDNSLGDRVPGMFAAQGVVDIEVYVNDKALAIFPPYATDAQRAAVEEDRDRLERGHWTWSESETRRYFLAGGGSERDFPGYFSRARASRERIVAGVESGQFHGTAGGAFFLTGGRKRATGATR
jgi:SAM-dependent methyltransferase